MVKANRLLRTPDRADIVEQRTVFEKWRTPWAPPASRFAESRGCFILRLFMSTNDYVYSFTDSSNWQEKVLFILGEFEIM